MSFRYIRQSNSLRYLVGTPGVVGGIPGEFLVGVSRPVLKILTLFHIKKMLFPTPVSDLSLKSMPIFRPGIGRI